jgi:hypothetical protein
MYGLVRRSTRQQLTREELPLLMLALCIAEVFFKFHSFLLESGAFLLTWLALGALHASLKSLLGHAPEHSDAR